ncbi:hypothetical protein ALC57_01058, partial [Trachymyrmex cornetzi]
RERAAREDRPSRVKLPPSPSLFQVDNLLVNQNDAWSICIPHLKETLLGQDSIDTPNRHSVKENHFFSWTRGYNGSLVENAGKWTCYLRVTCFWKCWLAHCCTFITLVGCPGYPGLALTVGQERERKRKRNERRKRFSRAYHPVRRERRGTERRE